MKSSKQIRATLLLLLTAVIWTILLYYINLGLKQLEEAKKRAGTVQK